MNFVRPPTRWTNAARMGCDMEEAALRVFSNAEGAYGSNVNALVDSGAWGEEDELADAYEAAQELRLWPRRARPKKNGRPAAGRAEKTFDLAYQKPSKASNWG